MKSLVLISTVLIQLTWCYGSPKPDGVGVFAYEDSAGLRYECVYKPIYDHGDDSRQPPDIKTLNKFKSGVQNFPDIFANIENQQRAAYEAAQNSFGAYNALPYIPNFDFRYPQYDYFNNFGSMRNFDMSGLNSAYAAGAIGPGFKHQVAAISPPNPQSPNIVKTSQYPDSKNGLGNRFYSVSSSSFASSVNNNGELQSKRGAETIVDDNGKITKYSVGN